MRSVMNVPVEILLSALEARKEPAAVLRDGEVLAENATAATLGDGSALAELAARAAVETVLVTVEGRILELRADVVDGLTVLTGHDVSEREELRRHQARSDEILRIGAHELRNPLHVVGMI